MKIFVASAPKTGNTWLNLLLSTVYNLESIQLPFPFDANAVEGMGSNWIALQHYRPTPDLLAWGEEHGAIFVTPIRHPGDLLVSLWHMLRNKSYDPKADMRYLQPVLRDGARMAKGTIGYVEQHFTDELRCMIYWMESNRSQIVRYEDLWRDPETTLAVLTDKIRPVSHELVEAAIDLCDINMLRKLRNDPQGKFFRRGGPGSWRDELPESILDIFGREPYPDLFQALGYTLDPQDPLIDAPTKPRVSTNPFVENNIFDNGVEVPTIAVQIFLLQDPAVKKTWSGVPTATSEGSFYTWLSAPADQDPYKVEQSPVITNLAFYAYSSRPGLQAQFPDLFGRDRQAYATWFYRYAEREYDLDKALVRPLQEVHPGTVKGGSENAPSLSPRIDHETTAGLAHAGMAEPRRIPALDRVHMLAQVNPHLPIAWPAWPKGLWPKVEALTKKVIRRMLGWYINPIVEQQNRFNTAAVEALDEMWKEISDIQEHLSRDKEENTK